MGQGQAGEQMKGLKQAYSEPPPPLTGPCSAFSPVLHTAAYVQPAPEGQVYDLVPEALLLLRRSLQQRHHCLSSCSAVQRQRRLPLSCRTGWLQEVWAAGRQVLVEALGGAHTNAACRALEHGWAVGTAQAAGCNPCCYLLLTAAVRGLICCHWHCHWWWWWWWWRCCRRC